MTSPVLLALALSAAAQEVDPTSGLALKRMCNGAPGTIAHASCVLYMTGFADGVQSATSAIHQLGQPLACVPRDATGEEIRQALLRAFEGHPERLRMPMNAAATAALGESYPCPKRAKR